MERPQGIYQAVVAIWATIALSAFSALVNKWIGSIDGITFVLTLFIYGLVCILPYKIDKGSNAARYTFTIFIAISFLLMLGGMGEDMPMLDYILSILLIPVDIFILYKLFQKESSMWFTNKVKT